MSEWNFYDQVATAILAGIGGIVVLGAFGFGYWLGH